MDIGNKLCNVIYEVKTNQELEVIYIPEQDRERMAQAVV